jgi:hypothetical protein
LFNLQTIKSKQASLCGRWTNVTHFIKIYRIPFEEN